MLLRFTSSLWNRIFGRQHPASLRQTLARRRRAASVEALEHRCVLAAATLSAGNLLIDFTATGTTAEAVTVSNNRTNITLTGSVSGGTTFSTSLVNQITVTDGGGSSAQTLTFNNGTALNLPNGLTSIGVETVNLNNSIDAIINRCISCIHPCYIANQSLKFINSL